MCSAGGRHLGLALHLHVALEGGRLLLVALALGASGAAWAGTPGGAGALVEEAVAADARFGLGEQLARQRDVEGGAVRHHEVDLRLQQAEQVHVGTGAVHGGEVDGVLEGADARVLAQHVLDGDEGHARLREGLGHLGLEELLRGIWVAVYVGF